MKVLTKEDINNISHWLFSNGRDVDVARYNCLFYKDPKELMDKEIKKKLLRM